MSRPVAGFEAEEPLQVQLHLLRFLQVTLDCSGAAGSESEVEKIQEPSGIHMGTTCERDTMCIFKLLSGTD